MDSNKNSRSRAQNSRSGMSNMQQIYSYPDFYMPQIPIDYNAAPRTRRPRHERASNAILDTQQASGEAPKTNNGDIDTCSADHGIDEAGLPTPGTWGDHQIEFELLFSSLISELNGRPQIAGNEYDFKPLLDGLLWVHHLLKRSREKPPPAKVAEPIIAPLLVVLHNILSGNGKAPKEIADLISSKGMFEMTQALLSHRVPSEHEKQSPWLNFLFPPHGHKVKDESYPDHMAVVVLVQLLELIKFIQNPNLADG